MNENTKSQLRSHAIRVCLLWHGVDSGNLGVRALTESQIHLIRQAADAVGTHVDFEIVGWAGSSDPGKFRQLGVQLVTPVNGRSMLSRSGVRAAFRRADVVLDIGEGDSFSDIYGLKRLLYFAVTKWMATTGSVPLVLSPQTIGPFSSWWSIAISDFCLRRAASIFPRDELSRQYVAARNLGVSFDEIVDVAFALPYERTSHGRADHLTVGVNISGLLWNEASGSNRFKLQLDYRALTRQLLEHFTRMDAVHVVLVPHVLGEAGSVDDDLSICEAMQREFPNTSIAPRYDGPSAAKSHISGFDFFIGARMHACIAAISSGVPVVPLAYSRKFTGLFNTVGYPHVADCRSLDVSAVMSLVRQTFEQRAHLSATIQDANDIAAARLKIYTDKIAELLASAKNRDSI
ncbi:polysaccharide pyruvyl transferase family protein [Aquincola sp. MAHUQ-54]|uniref:Polysaccharide pyruvyl transferase family protein n=1 Tax=Aquincola agrisoli TaxID=3119538 RepID=A0AAW9QND0_9BURK